jgi:hypothetical protein
VRKRTTCNHRHVAATGRNRTKTCQVTWHITPIIPSSWIVVDAKLASLNGISKSTTLWSAEACKVVGIVLKKKTNAVMMYHMIQWQRLFMIDMSK